MRCLRFLLLIICGVGWGGYSQVVADSQLDVRPVRHGLLVVSYHMTHPWTEQLVKAILAGIEDLPVRLDFNVVELDTLRIRDDGWKTTIFAEQLARIQAGKYDLIVAVDDVAVDLILANYKNLPPEVPLVFAGYESDSPELKQEHPNVTGVVQELDMNATLRAMRSLYPNVKKVAVLADSAATIQTFQRYFSAEIARELGLEISFMDSSDGTISQLFERVEALPEDSLVLLLPWRSLAGNDYQTMKALGIDLSRSVQHPYWVCVDTLIGHGALGGYLTDSVRHGRRAAQLIGEVIEQNGAENVPIVYDSATPTFDYRMLEADGVGVANLPSDAVLRNLPLSPWKLYWKYVLIGVGILAALLIGGGGYLVMVRRNSRRNQELFRAFPGRVGVLDVHERVLFLDTENPAEKKIRCLRDFPNVDYPKFSAEVAKVFRTGKRCIFEYECNTESRTVTLAPLSRRLFGVNAVICFAQDNTELRSARQEALRLSNENQENLRSLQLSTQFWAQVIDSIPILFFAKDPAASFRHVLCNQAFADFTGKTHDEIIGKTDAELFPSFSDLKNFSSRDEAALLHPEGISYEETVTDASGVTRHFKTLKKPFDGPGGRRLVLCVASDVSELKHMISCERTNVEILANTVRETEFEKVLEDLAAVLRRRVKCDRVILAKCNAQGKLRLDWEWHGPEVVDFAAFNLEEHYRLWDEHLPEFQDDKIFKVTDIGANPQLKILQADSQYRTQSLIVAPVFVEGNLWGALLVSYSLQRREFSVTDESLMRSCANVIALAEIRERQNCAIRRANQENQMILDHIKIPISLHDAFGNLLLVNAAVCRLTGKSEAELLAEPQREIFFVDRHAPADSPLKQVIAGENSAATEVEIGRCRYIIHADAVYDKNGKLVNVVKSAIDVTDLNELLKSQKAINFCLETLLRENDSSKAIDLALKTVGEQLGASRCAIFQIDSAEGLVSVYSEYRGIHSENIFSKIHRLPSTTVPSWSERFMSLDFCAFPDVAQNSDGLGADWRAYIKRWNIRSLYVNRILCDGEVWGYIALIYEERPHSLSKEETRFVNSFAHFFEFLLERRRSQAQILNALRKAQAADKAKSFFIASVSHEIRTPLNAVIGFAELLRDGAVKPEEQKEYLDSIAYSGNALLQLINDVLDLSKLEAGQMQIVTEACDFAALGQEVLRVFTHRAEEQHLELIGDMPPLPTLELDKLRIRQILFNLIGNAVKFTPQGSVTLWAEFAPQGVGFGRFRFGVTDTGVGIPEKDQRRLMEPFVQSSNNIRGNCGGNGTGLGLAISKRLVEKMGGSLTLDSREGQGSTFVITLEHVLFRQQTMAIEAQASGRSFLVRTPISILLVDDVDMNLKVLKAMCTRAGLSDLVCVSSGSAALAELAKRSFDLILTDMWMPEMSGAELAQKIRQGDSPCRHIPIIAITADVEARDNFVLDHFSGVLLKPITLDKIAKVIELYDELSGSVRI